MEFQHGNKPNFVITFMSINAIMLLLLLFCLFSCVRAKKKNHWRFDEYSLEKFIVSDSGESNGNNRLFLLDSILENASSDSILFRKTVFFLSAPLSDPNSPYRNEELCVRLLQAEISSNSFSPIEKKNASSKLFVLQQNSVGEAANDFSYLLADGTRASLYNIQSKFCILLFYNPECAACKDMNDSLMSSQIIADKLDVGELKVLAIYVDSNKAMWREYLPEQPMQWIQGIDENEDLFNKKIYDLTAIPTVYLLDKNKTVLLKDCGSVAVIENILLQPNIKR